MFSGFSATLSILMARLARVIAVDVPHHITQRANARRFILDSDSDRLVYLDLLRQYCPLYGLSLLGYCLMSNHVHLVATPAKVDSLPEALKQTHGRYAAYWNASHRSSGPAWQGRYYSYPLDEAHLWALYGTESGAGGHDLDTRNLPLVQRCRPLWLAQPDLVLDLELWSKHWNPATWKQYLAQKGSDADAEVIRQCTHTGRPLGSPEFVESLEKSLQRILAPQKGGRPAKSANANQVLLGFD